MPAVVVTLIRLGIPDGFGELGDGDGLPEGVGEALGDGVVPAASEDAGAGAFPHQPKCMVKASAATTSTSPPVHTRAGRNGRGIRPAMTRHPTGDSHSTA